jgi:carbonic anhydrase
MHGLRLVALTLMGCSLATAAKEATHWGYSGETGPARWARLSPDFATCASGRNQSPVDITGAVEARLPSIRLAYRPGGQEIVNNGHAIQVNYAPGSTLTVGARRFELKQFHFHAPSENHVGGQSFAMEAHQVHADDDGNAAVVAVMFERGAANPALAAFWDRIPGIAGGRGALEQPADAAALLPPNHDHYRFSGSLTTPPCSEGVLWLVMKAPASVSDAQLTAFTKALGGIENNRPLQPLNARSILE